MRCYVLSSRRCTPGEATESDPVKQYAEAGYAGWPA
jgi:hypothetical protein